MSRSYVVEVPAGYGTPDNDQAVLADFVRTEIHELATVTEVAPAAIPGQSLHPSILVFMKLGES